ncbi:hypothetical protein [Brevibacterium oceani]|uniref:hypothetical protein n=1 Tax=Brevibacterium oceani TaxID=358099 RepID=UPI0015E723F5|nr:hypothetical protein [Brevibacterium oceani]
MSEAQKIIDELHRKHHETGELLLALAGLLPGEQGSGSAAAGGEAESEHDEGAHRGIELGERVHLDEDIYSAPPAHSPARVYLFEQFDSEAPAEMNCTLVDVATGDWQVRGIGELVPVDDRADEEGGV